MPEERVKFNLPKHVKEGLENTVKNNKESKDGKQVVRAAGAQTLLEELEGKKEDKTD